MEGVLLPPAFPLRNEPLRNPTLLGLSICQGWYNYWFNYLSIN